MFERKLVTIRKVSNILPIENADLIELALIDGWQCVVRKGEFKIGDLGLYFEIDSFLPIEERYEFLRKSSYRKLPDDSEGFRLKTIRLKGKLSQGLLLPLSIFPEIKPEMGKDYAEILKVVKYEPPLPANLNGIAKGIFPSFIKKSDQERIQNLPEFFELCKDKEFEETEKEDGTSATYYCLDGTFGYCSRNLELKEEGENTYNKIAHELRLKETLLQIQRNIAIQGEIVGDGINKNHLKIKGVEFHVFDIYDIDKRRLLLPEERISLIKNMNNPRIKHIPILKSNIKIFQICKTMQELLEYAKGKSTHNPNAEREGLVFKSVKLDDNNQTISFKVVNNEYLLKSDE
jgi:RNA ligase (TIGR02306 family)